MVQILAAIFAVLLGSVLMKLGNAMLSLTVTLTLNENGTSLEVIGLVSAAFSGGFLLGGFYARRMIGAVGHVRALSLTTAVAAIATLAFPLVLDGAVWAGLRAIYGFTGAVAYIVFESWLNERATPDTRGRVLGVYATANYFALTLGQLLINTTPLGGGLAFSLCAALLLAGLMPVVATSLPQPELKAAQRLSARQLYRESPLAVVTVTGGGLMSGGLFGMVAVFAQDIGLPLLRVTLLTGAYVFGAFLLMWLIGRFSDKFGRRAALALALGAVVALSAVMALSGELAIGFWGLVAIALVLGANMLSIYHSAVAHAYDRLPKEHYVAASGSFQIFFSVGSIGGPIITGFLMERLGPYSLWVYSAAIAALLLAFVAYRWIVRPAVTVEVDAPSTQPAPQQVVSN